MKLKFSINTEDENYIPLTERDTECDRCPNLQDCIDNGNVLNCNWWSDRRQHYIKGLNCRCVKGVEHMLEKKLSEIREVADDKKMIELIDKAIEQLGDMTYKEFYQDGRCFEMKFD